MGAISDVYHRVFSPVCVMRCQRSTKTVCINLLNNPKKLKNGVPLQNRFLLVPSKEDKSDDDDHDDQPATPIDDEELQDEEVQEEDDDANDADYGSRAKSPRKSPRKAKK